MFEFTKIRSLQNFLFVLFTAKQQFGAQMFENTEIEEFVNVLGSYSCCFSLQNRVDASKLMKMSRL